MLTVFCYCRKRDCSQKVSKPNTRFNILMLRSDDRILINDDLHKYGNKQKSTAKQSEKRNTAITPL